MMSNIDEIMEMIDWSQSKETQAKGCELARNVRSINVFILPYGKNVWDNCAKILAARNDEELEPYIYDLFEWLEDENWPGAECIWKRLLLYKSNERFVFALDSCIRKSQRMMNHCWEGNLRRFKSEWQRINLE